MDVNKSVCLMYGCDRDSVLNEPVETRSLGTTPYSLAEIKTKMKLALK